MLPIFHEAGTYIAVLSKDVAFAKFWRRTTPALIPVILGAIAVSSNLPRLILTADAKGPLYKFRGEKIQEPSEFTDGLKRTIQQRLASKLSLFSECQPTESPSRDYLTDGALLEAEVPATLKATNGGRLNTTIEAVRVYVVEDIDGKRRSFDDSGELKIEKHIGQGASVEITKADGINISLNNAAPLLLQYEVARLLCSTIRDRYPKEVEWLGLSDPYLIMLGGSEQTRERMYRLTNPSVRSRVLMIVEVRDIYNRVGRAEVTLIDSIEWTVRRTR